MSLETRLKAKLHPQKATSRHNLQFELVHSSGEPAFSIALMIGYTKVFFPVALSLSGDAVQGKVKYQVEARAKRFHKELLSME